MGFSLSKHLQDEVLKLVSSKEWDPEQATPIPDTPGMVLVKHGTMAFQERMASKGVFMIPVEVEVTSDGVRVKILCFVCTQ